MLCIKMIFKANNKEREITILDLRNKKWDIEQYQMYDSNQMLHDRNVEDTVCDKFYTILSYLHMGSGK